LKDESSLKKYCGSGYRYWIIKNSGHYPMIEQPDRFNFLLKEAIAVANAR
jgi:pimeloyl-ACP methyl ester carboxylesterase